MPLHPLAGKPAPPEALIDVGRLEREFLNRTPDPSNPRERVKFGTSGHRGTPLDGSLTAAHIVAITQAICDYRRTNGIDGPLYMGKDTHALSSLSQDAALEVLAANGVETIIQRDGGFTPTPVISRAIIVRNRGRSAHLADGIVITPSHNPPEDGGFKYNPPNGGPADTDVTRWMQDRANELLGPKKAEIKRVPLATAHEGGDDARRRSRRSLRRRPDRSHRHRRHPRRQGQDRRRPARRRVAALLAGDRRTLRPRHHHRERRRSIRRSGS